MAGLECFHLFIVKHRRIQVHQTARILQGFVLVFVPIHAFCFRLGSWHVRKIGLILLGKLVPEDRIELPPYPYQGVSYACPKGVGGSQGMGREIMSVQNSPTTLSTGHDCGRCQLGLGSQEFGRVLALPHERGLQYYVSSMFLECGYSENGEAPCRRVQSDDGPGAPLIWSDCRSARHGAAQTPEGASHGPGRSSCSLAALRPF